MDYPPPPHNNRPTSIAAAERVHNAATLRESVFNAIAAAGDHGMTDEELQDLLGMDGNTERPRRWELSTSLKLPQRICEKGKRPTRSGRQAVVWVVKKNPTTTASIREEQKSFF